MFIRDDGRRISGTAYRDAIDAANDQGIFEEFIIIHQSYAAIFHRGLPFLPWHRLFILAFESRIRNIEISGRKPFANFALPFWIWRTGSDVNAYPWQDEILGKLIRSENVAEDGRIAEPSPFRDFQVRSNSGRVRGPLKRYLNSSTLFAVSSFAPDQIPVAGLMQSGNQLDTSPYNQHAQNSFRQELEGHHDEIHNWLGGAQISNQGAMSFNAISANDPAFYMHHAEVDRLWWIWQWRRRAQILWPENGALSEAKRERQRVIQGRLHPLASDFEDLREELASMGASTHPTDFNSDKLLTPWDDIPRVVVPGLPPVTLPPVTVANVLNIRNIPHDLLGPGTGDVSYHYRRPRL